MVHSMAGPSFKRSKSVGIVVERVWRNLLKVERMTSSDVFEVISCLICSLHSFNRLACCAHWQHEVGTLQHLPGNEEVIKDALRKNYRLLNTKALQFFLHKIKSCGTFEFSL